MAANVCGPEVVDNGKVERKIEAAGWGTFFVWVGVALIADVGWGVGLIGVGTITLLGQAARRYFGVKTEILWIVIGLLFLLGGLWACFNIHFHLLPVFCVLAGIALLVSLFTGKSKNNA